MTRICGAEKKVTPLKTSQEMEIASMPVLEEAGNSLETRSDKLFMNMWTGYGAHTCSTTLTNVSLQISNVEPWTDPSGELSNKPYFGAKSTKYRL
eukprot:15536591-Heterocapsa_arctica.AAC.1